MENQILSKELALGQSNLNSGRFLEARQRALSLLEKSPGLIGALWIYVSSGRVDRDDPVFQRLQNLGAHNGVPPEQASQIQFMLGKCWDDCGEIDKAFTAFCAANRLKSAPYDQSGTRALAEALMSAEEGLPEALRNIAFGPRMVFVLGMPRSGTSLMAQMLGAHHGITNLGECTALAPALALERRGQNPHLAFLTEATRQRLASARTNYLNAIGATDHPGQVLVDKMPENWWFAPMIPRLFPDALILHMRRPRLATAWSCFRNDFSVGHGYATDFTQILAQYDLHLRLANQGRRRAAPGQWHEISLDDLTARPRDVLEPLLAALGLEWDEACLAPEAGGDMPTLSKWQIRQGISPGLAQGWMRYLPLIEKTWGVSE